MYSKLFLAQLFQPYNVLHFVYNTGSMLESRFKHPIVASALLSALEELLLLYFFRFSTFGEWGFEFDLAVTYFSQTPPLFDY